MIVYHHTCVKFLDESEQWVIVLMSFCDGIGYNKVTMSYFPPMCHSELDEVTGEVGY